jgi:hypothetical protein
MTDEQRAARIAALIRERDGYLARGLAERAEQVSSELRSLGHTAQPPAKRAQRRSSSDASRGRARGTETL